MLTYKFISRTRGIFRLEEYLTVQAPNLSDAQAQVGSQYQLFTITK